MVYEIVFDDSSATFQLILPDIGQLMGGTRMIYKNQSVSVTTEGNLSCTLAVENYNDLCIRLSIVSKCDSKSLNVE